MIDVEQTRDRIESKWFPACERHAGCPVRIADEDITEYEWGWVFCCQELPLTGTAEMGNYFTKFLVTRLTGRFFQPLSEASRFQSHA